MTTLHLKRTLAGLEAGDDDAAVALRRIKPGDIVKADIARPRNMAAHRRYWALVQLIYDNSIGYASPDVVHGHLKILAGHADPVVNKATGETFLIPRSISFSAMDEDEFQAFWRRAVDAVVTHILPGVSEQEIETEILRVCGLAGGQR